MLVGDRVGRRVGAVGVAHRRSVEVVAGIVPRPRRPRLAVPMLTLVLTRHGLTDRSTPEQHLGQRIDVSINDAGRRQAEALARRLAPVTFDRVFTSPLFRARETAVAPRAQRRHRGRPAAAGDGLRRVGRAGRTTRSPSPTADFRRALGGGARHARVPRRRVRQRRRRARRRSFLQRPARRAPGWHAKASFRAATSGWGCGDPARSSGRCSPSRTSTTNRILICLALAHRDPRVPTAPDQDQANLTVLRWELDAAPDEATDAGPQRHRAPAAGRRGALVLAVRPRVSGARLRTAGAISVLSTAVVSRLGRPGIPSRHHSSPRNSTMTPTRIASVERPRRLADLCQLAPSCMPA